MSRPSAWHLPPAARAALDTGLQRFLHRAQAQQVWLVDWTGGLIAVAHRPDAVVPTGDAVPTLLASIWMAAYQAHTTATDTAVILLEGQQMGWCIGTPFPQTILAVGYLLSETNAGLAKHAIQTQDLGLDAILVADQRAQLADAQPSPTTRQRPPLASLVDQLLRD